MSDKSAIEWTDSTWNPIRALAPFGKHFCLKISPGCDHCYAGAMQAFRYGGQDYERVGTAAIEGAKAAVENGAIYLDEKIRQQPYHWRKPRRVFVCSMTDLFGEWVPVEWIVKMLDVMVIARWHTFQVLTKRPKRMHEALGGVALPANIWIGTTVEADAYSWRADYLRRMVTAGARFVSAEPLIGPLPSLDLTGIDWLITGGESGAGCRPCDPDWVRDLRDRSLANGTAFFHKQWGGRTPKAGGRLLDGREWSEFPEAASAGTGGGPHG